MLNFDEEENAGFSLYWARRYNHDLVDSACSAGQDTQENMMDTMNSVVPEVENTTPPRLVRQGTPDPRARYHQRGEILTPKQAEFWNLDQAQTKDQEMNTAVGAVMDNLVNSENIMKMELEDWDDAELAEANLGDSMSNTNIDKINKLLENLYQPESPGHHGVKGEKIIPNTAAVEGERSKVTVRRKLSPTADPFVPASKRPNLASSSEGRSGSASLSSTVDWLSMSMTIKEGDDALTGLNIADLDKMDNMEDTLRPPPDTYQTAQPLTASPRLPPPGQGRSRMLRAEKYQ